MTQEREDYMRRREMDHDLIRQRDPDKAVRKRVMTETPTFLGLWPIDPERYRKD